MELILTTVLLQMEWLKMRNYGYSSPTTDTLHLILYAEIMSLNTNSSQCVCPATSEWDGKEGGRKRSHIYIVTDV